MTRTAIDRGELFQAIIDDDVFAALPQQLAKALGGRSVLFHCHYSGSGADVLAHSGYFRPEHLDLYATQFASADPWARAAVTKQPINKAISLDDIVTEAEFGRSAFYNEYIRGIGDDTFHCMGIRVARPWGSAMIAVQRGKSGGRFDDAEVQALQEEMNPLRHILALRGRFSASLSHARTLEEVLNKMPQAAMLADRSSRLVFANANAEVLLRRGTTFTVKNGILSPAAESAMGWRNAVERACDSQDARESVLKFDRPGVLPTLISVTPIRDGARRALALLVIHSTIADEDAVERRLQQLFKLSPAEAKVACSLANGWSTNEISEARSSSIETVRSQLKSVAAKLGCRRQSEVVAVVNSIILTTPAELGPAGREL